MYSGEYPLYMWNGESSYKCGACVKQLRTDRDDNTHLRSLRSASASEIGMKIVSPDRELIIPALKDSNSLCPA
jgi:hypothetical protein